MNVYEEDSDHFSAEYLAYLDTLTSEVRSDARVRITRNPKGETVRFEVWLGESECYGSPGYAYYDFPFPGWMKP